MAFELISLRLRQLVPGLVAGLHECLVALELARGVANLLASHVSTSTADVADVDSVISLPTGFRDLALLANDTFVNGNNGTGGAIGGFDTSLAIGVDGQILVTMIPMTLEGLGMVGPVMNAEVMHFDSS